MNSIKEKITDISTLIGQQLPSFVTEQNPKFVSFLSAYYESQETKYGNLDIVRNFIEYYNIGHYSPNKLIEYTTLTNTISDSVTTITVLSTDGFPEANGYIQIGDEYIFYKTKTKTQFLECARGTSTFVLEDSYYNQIGYKTGVPAYSHNQNAKVVNIGFYFVKEFINRIKSEISPSIPEVLTPELNISSFLKNVKSFYLSKGSAQSHQTLFRILFNDKKIRLRLKPSGTGAKIEILNYTGSISEDAVVSLISGGSGYYYEDDNGTLVSPPVIDVLGSGTGVPDQYGKVPPTAQLIVTEMNSNGAITAVDIQNAGTGYIGPITARIRERTFTQGQEIYNIDANGNTTGYAKVESWDYATTELLLNDIIGYFKIGDTIVGKGGENPRSYITKAYPATDINREGNPSISTISQDPIVEYPTNHLFKPSASTYYIKKVIRCELIPELSQVDNIDNVKFIELVQSRDLNNKISGTAVDITEISQIEDKVYEFELDTKLEYQKLYLPSSTHNTQQVTITNSSNSTLNVDSTFNFPHTKGRIFVNGKVIQYASRTNTAFVGCNLVTVGSLVIPANSNVYLYGRECLTSGEVSYFLKGYIDGNRNSTPIVFRLHALPSQPFIVEGGSLYSSDTFELDPAETYRLSKTSLTAKKYSSGEIDSIIIENPGINYRTGDKLVINNAGNQGTGFAAQVSNVVGKTITAYSIEILYSKSCIKFTTSTPHNLSSNDKIKFNTSLGSQVVLAIVSDTQFVLENIQGLTTLNISGLSYITNSRTATGSINNIAITNTGKNYSKLPEVTDILSQTGYGALVQLNSNNIGKLTKFTYDSIGHELIGNKTTEYPVIIPSTAKIINNFEIGNIEVLSGGNVYNPNTDVVLVNGVVNSDCEFKIITTSGVITAIEIINGGFNFSSIPTISVQSAFGSGAQFIATLKRKRIGVNDILTFSGGSIKVVSFDTGSSTLEFYTQSGSVTDNILIKTPDAKNYGNIISIRSATVYCNPVVFASYTHKFLDNVGFISDPTQKILDSDYHQEWSYSLVSQRNTSEWKPEVIENTHPAGYKVYGKNRLENKKELFLRQEDIFNSAVLFKSSLSNSVQVKSKLAKCKTQKLIVNDSSGFAIGDWVYGNISGAMGIITSPIGGLNENYIEVTSYTETLFTPDDTLVVVTRDFILYDVVDPYDKLVFWDGILQIPVQSYNYSNGNIIPNFIPVPDSNIMEYSLTSNITVLQYQQLSSTTISLRSGNTPFSPTIKDTLLIAINGVLQAANTFTLSGSTVTLSETITGSDIIKIIHHPNLKALTFTGSVSTYTLNYTPPSSCATLIFSYGVHQTESLTDFTLTGNQVVLSEPVTASNLYGWYIDETVSCNLLTYNELNANRIRSVDPCTVKKVIQYFESNGYKTFNSIFELTKNLLDGTVFAGADTTTVYGYDTKFIKTSPEYSSSFVEVLNKIEFNNIATTFGLKYMNGVTYTPLNGKDSLVVYVDNVILDPSAYSVSGSNITFNTIYGSSSKSTILDFNSRYLANDSNKKGANLDNLNVAHNGVRTRFNLSDNGVPQYARNVADVFAIKNGKIQNPKLQSITQNKIDFNTAPEVSDTINLGYFNRQLSSTNAKNVVLDSFKCFNGVNLDFPLTLNGILINPISVYHVFLVRNGVYLQPNIDYTIINSHVRFTTAPSSGDTIFVYYSYNGLDQNFAIDPFKKFDGVNTRFALTSNYSSISNVANDINLQVIKNGMYLYPSTDYTVGGNVNGKYIDLSVAPVSNDIINIVNYEQNDIVDVTSRFTQLSSTTLQYTSQSPVIDTSVFLVYVNGSLIPTSGWSFSANVLTFTSFVSLTLDNVRILAFQSQKRKLDSITKLSGVDTYTLSISSVGITTSLPNVSDLIVSVTGVVISGYTITGNQIKLPPSVNTGSVVSIYQIGSSSYPTELIDSLNDNYSKSTYKLLNNYSSVNPVTVTDVVVFRNGVVQKPNDDFTIFDSIWIPGDVYTDNTSPSNGWELADITAPLEGSWNHAELDSYQPYTGCISFSTNIDENDEILILYCHGTELVQLNSITSNSLELVNTPAVQDYNNYIVHLNGVPQTYPHNFSISGNTITLSESVDIQSVFVVKYANISYPDSLTDCPNGSRTTFRLLYNYQNLIPQDIVSEVDILVSINGIVKYPGIDYTIDANRALITFAVAPLSSDDIFAIRMYGNQLVTLTSNAGSNTVFNLNTTIQSQEQEYFAIFTNGVCKFKELGEYSFTTTSRVTLNAANSGPIFGIKFFGQFRMLDQTNTPFNGSTTKFNMFLDEENMIPSGTIENDAVPDPSGILVFKNGLVLDPGVDYTLVGDMKSQIQFTTAPSNSDAISIKSVGSFRKLQTITSGFGGKVYNLRYSNSDNYYPNFPIERPRKHENQILVIKDGVIQSPLYDYFINNDNIQFINNVSATKLVVLDFQGTQADITVLNSSNQISVGDNIIIDGESSDRTVTQVLSPTLLKTKSYTSPKPSGFVATTTVSGGILTGVNIANGGSGYTSPAILRTFGVGSSAKAVASINYSAGNSVAGPVEIQYPGYNQYVSASLHATTYAYSYKQVPLNTSNVRIATKLSSNITNSVVVIPIANGENFEQSTFSISITSSTGSGATLRPFVSKGKISKVDVLTSGIGYNDTDITLSVSGGGGYGCVLEPVLDSMGSLVQVIVRNGGIGYDSYRVIIENEIIEYTNIVSNQLVGCTRGTPASAHVQNDLVYFDKFI